MATIKPIQAASVHQIQSGQVIVDLCSVVKELVENSLDAGASSIEVRLKHNGLDSIEVQDNGSGIAKEDYDGVAKKHHTSKLSTYDDLESLATFGFRGEALSSLCALSNFHVITAVEGSGPKGTRLDFQISGDLRGTTVVAAQKGTTVVVEDLFKNLPVRRKELEKNVKREYSKVLNLLQAYACISTNVRFSVSNQPPKGKRTTAFSTQSNATTKENIVNVFGSKTSTALIDLSLTLEMQVTSVRNIGRGESGTKQVQIRGHVSRPAYGEGRQAPDRQMFFVNSRPCGLPQVAKAFNEVYRNFNTTQSPFVFADLVMDTNNYDVNVSPDKRTILLHDKEALLESLKEALTGLFDAQEQRIPTSQMQTRYLPHFRPPTLLRHTSSGQSPDESSTSPARVDDSMSIPVAPVSTASESALQARISKTAETRASMPVLGVHNSLRSSTPTTIIRTEEQRVLQEEVRDLETPASIPSSSPDKHVFLTLSKSSDKLLPKDHPCLTKSVTISRPGKVADARSQSKDTSSKPTRRITTETVELEDDNIVERGEDNDDTDDSDLPRARFARFKSDTGPVQKAYAHVRPKRQREDLVTVQIGENSPSEVVIKASTSKRARLSSYGDESAEMTTNSRSRERTRSSDGQLDNDMHLQDDRRQPDELTYNDQDADAKVSDESDDEYLDEDGKKALEDSRVARLIAAAEEAAAQPREDMLRKASQVLKFDGGRKDYTYNIEHTIAIDTCQLGYGVPSLVDRPKDLALAADAADHIDDAETKLSLIISKSDFAEMQVLGQFNLGFILALRPASATSSNGDHIFIIDQHAADEKFNFERLYATTTLIPQRLVTPKYLQLSAVEEELVHVNNLSLMANGFQIETVNSTTEEGKEDMPANEPSSAMDSNSTIGSRLRPDMDGEGQRSFRLLTLPTSKETTFSIADLEELLHLLSEAPLPADAPFDDTDFAGEVLTSSTILSTNSLSSSRSSIIRPSRVRKMLAMRACRSSIMVGKTLTRPQMTNVVRHMGEMEKPWNCPHGRPTMRHLAALSDWKSWDDDGASLGDWTGYASGR